MIRLLVLMLVGILALPGCTTSPLRRQGPPPTVEELEPADQDTSYEAPLLPEPGLRLSTEQRFGDVPLPVGVKPDFEKTYVFESASLRLGRMVYTTRASVNELAQFYIKECPTTQWKLKNVIEAEGVVLLFKKPGYSLEVRARSVGIGLKRQLALTLTPIEATGS